LGLVPADLPHFVPDEHEKLADARLVVGDEQERTASQNVPDIWQVKKVNPQSMIHLTEKPVELAERAITYSSLPGENVLDLFGGSGSTLVGAERTGRTAYLMELDPLYCDVIVQRFETLTGTKAERVPAPDATRLAYAKRPHDTPAPTPDPVP